MMTYSQSTRKPNLKRFYRTLIVGLIVGLLFGAVIGSVAMNNIFYTKKVQVPEENIDSVTETEPAPMYGTRDGRTFSGGSEMSLDWSSGDLNFIPLEVDLDVDTQEFIYYLSYGYYIDFPFVMALIQHESRFDSEVISKTNDYGLMQINTCNHEWLTETLGISDFLNPTENVRAGLYILRNLFEKYDDPAKVLMAYNMGESGAKRLWDKGIYETSYSNEVLAKAQQYENFINERMVSEDD